MSLACFLLLCFFYFGGGASKAPKGQWRDIGEIGPNLGTHIGVLLEIQMISLVQWGIKPHPKQRNPSISDQTNPSKGPPLASPVGPRRSRLVLHLSQELKSLKWARSGTRKKTDGFYEKQSSGIHPFGWGIRSNLETARKDTEQQAYFQ